MTLIVEDGTMPTGANTYADLATCDAWQAVRASEGWPNSEGETEEAEISAKKEAALVLATDYLNGLSWRGKRAAGGRVMAWPRLDIVDPDGYEIAADTVPLQVVNACCYLAGQVYQGVDLQPVLERGGRIQSEGVSSLSTSYFDDASNRDVFSALADMLAGLATGLDGSKRKFQVVEIMRA